MKSPAILVISCILSISSPEKQLPTTYEYFTQGGIRSGLTADKPGFFKLNGKDIRIVSGSIHYFRIHPKLWRTSLRKLRSLGANTVATYIPWNVHEPERGVFDFGTGGRDLSQFLNVRRFVQMASEEDLLVIMRAGPFIASEWDYGGMPSWLLRDPNMKVRSDYGPWIEAMETYFKQLLSQMGDLQFAKGGAIVGVQVENEYGGMWPRSTTYLQRIIQIFSNYGFRQSLFFTNTVPLQLGSKGTLPGVLNAASIKTNVQQQLDILKKMQPNRPIMVIEYQTVIHPDWWASKHYRIPANEYISGLERIFKDYAGSVNFYVFQGGTNFGFMAGSYSYPNFRAIVTSYESNGILTEAGDYTEKYYSARDLIAKYQVPKLRRPKHLAESQKGSYGKVSMHEYLNYFDIIAQVPKGLRSHVQKPVAMEELNINGGNGQSYGYIIYRSVYYNDLGHRPFSLTAGPVNDFGMVIVDGIRQWSYWFNKNIDTTLSFSPGPNTLDILVENCGRAIGVWEKDFKNSKKGLPNGWVSVNEVELSGFEVIPLEFKSKWMLKLKGWKKAGRYDFLVSSPGPALFRSTFTVKGRPTDTFLDMKGWDKGIVFINAFNIGRYWEVGPQKRLYVPGPLLRRGENSIVVFEQLKPGNFVRFISAPKLG